MLGTAPAVPMNGGRTARLLLHIGVALAAVAVAIAGARDLVTNGSFASYCVSAFALIGFLAAVREIIRSRRASHGDEISERTAARAAALFVATGIAFITAAAWYREPLASRVDSG